MMPDFTISSNKCLALKDPEDIIPTRCHRFLNHTGKHSDLNGRFVEEWD